MGKNKKMYKLLVLLFFITMVEACYAKIIDINSYARIKRIDHLEIKKPINAQATLIISDLGKDARGNKAYHFGYACTTCKNLKITRINLYDEKQYPIASQQSNENKGDVVMANSWVGWLSPSIPQYYDIEFDQSNNNISKGTMPELEASLKTSPNPGESVELTLTNISSKDITITKITLPATNAIENNDLPGLAPKEIKHGESIKFELKPGAMDKTNILDLSDRKFVIGFEYTGNNESINSVYTGGIYIAYSYDWSLEKARSDNWGTKEKIGAVVGGAVVGGCIAAGIIKRIQANEADDDNMGIPDDDIIGRERSESSSSSSSSASSGDLSVKFTREELSDMVSGLPPPYTRRRHLDIGSSSSSSTSVLPPPPSLPAVSPRPAAILSSTPVIETTVPKNDSARESKLVESSKLLSTGSPVEPDVVSPRNISSVSSATATTTISPSRMPSISRKNTAESSSVASSQVQSSSPRGRTAARSPTSSPTTLSPRASSKKPPTITPPISPRKGPNVDKKH